MKKAQLLLPLVAALLSSHSYSQTVPDTASQHAEVIAWEQFSDSIKQTGVDFLKNSETTDPVTKAEALRYLAAQLGISINTMLSLSHPRPQMRLEMDDLRKLGLDASEAKYITARINGKGVYKLYGTLGTAKYTVVQLYGGTNSPQGGAYLNSEKFEPSANGHFEIIISAERPNGWKGPWLKLEPSDGLLFFREYFDDWKSETPSKLHITRLDQFSNPPLTQEAAASLVGTMSGDFKSRLPIWLRLAEAQKAKGDNVLSPEEIMPLGIGLATNRYGQGYFNLNDDEAMLIELSPPKSRFWSFQLGNYWWESLDYANNQSSLTSSQAKASSDGKYRLIISRKDPGYANWLDTTDHQEGMIFYRFNDAQAQSKIAYKTVKLRDLESILGDITPKVTPAERASEIQMRRDHVAKRWVP